MIPELFLVYMNINQQYILVLFFEFSTTQMVFKKYKKLNWDNLVSS